MSVIAMKWAFEQPECHKDMKPSEWAVLMVLADCHNPVYGCFPGQDYISSKTNLKERAVRDQLGRLRDRGLVNWNSARENGKRGSNRYKLAFEDGFQPANSAGSSTGEIEHEQPADSDSFNRRNLPPNLVREPVKEPVNEREGVREGVPCPNPGHGDCGGSSASVVSSTDPCPEPGHGETVTRATWLARLRRVHATWPTQATDSHPRAEKLWFGLSEEERQAAIDGVDAYQQQERKAGRKSKAAFTTYLQEKRWKHLPDDAVKTSGTVEVAAPFGKLWGACRFADLVRPPYGPPPRITATEDRLIAQGHYDRAELYRQKQANTGWPKVSTMHEQAVRRHKGVPVPADLEPLGELFDKVAKGGEAWAAWKALHDERGWPWFGADRDCPDFVWMPAPPDDWASYNSPLEAVRAAMTRFETEHATITNRDAAE